MVWRGRGHTERGVSLKSEGPWILVYLWHRTITFDQSITLTSQYEPSSFGALLWVSASVGKNIVLLNLTDGDEAFWSGISSGGYAEPWGISNTISLRLSNHKIIPQASPPIAVLESFIPGGGQGMEGTNTASLSSRKSSDQYWIDGLGALRRYFQYIKEGHL